MPKVSVIIPIYGVERFIERCARSLFEQTLDDIEYIFINDCTIDKSIEILTSVISDYPERAGQISIITMDKNSGQALVRRRGIEIASGDYIIHCDSDDYIENNMYETMYIEAVKGGYDIVVCDYTEVSKWGGKRKGKRSESSFLTEDILLLESGFLWNKLVRADIVKSTSIVYPESNFEEDLVLSIQYSILSKRVAYIDSPLYYYDRRDNSIVGDRSSKRMVEKFWQGKKNLDIVFSALEQSNLSDKLYGPIVFTKLLHKNLVLNVKPYKVSRKLWRNTYKEISGRILSCDCISKHEKKIFVIAWLGLFPIYNAAKSSLRKWKEHLRIFIQKQ